MEDGSVFKGGEAYGSSLPIQIEFLLYDSHLDCSAYVSQYTRTSKFFIVIWG